MIVRNYAITVMNAQHMLVRRFSQSGGWTAEFLPDGIKQAQFCGGID